MNTFTKISSALLQAYELAKAETGFDIPMSQASVADAPHDFENRLIPYEEVEFKHLAVMIPEIHDFILMKTIRGYAHDLDVIEEISRKNKADKNILIERYEKEMRHIVGSKNTLKLNFTAVLARCFGEDTAEGWSNKTKTTSR